MSEGRITRFVHRPGSQARTPLKAALGLETVLGARVLGEFGDDPTRFSEPKSRKNYAGTSPVTKPSGHSRVVLARFARNRRLGDACDQWAFAPSTLHGSPQLLRPAARPEEDPSTGPQTARESPGRDPPHLPERGVLYDELVAWPEYSELAA